jgi:hypothetical protein
MNFGIHLKKKREKKDYWLQQKLNFFVTLKAAS